MDDSPEYWMSILGESTPLYATLPTPGAPNELAQVELVAKELGTPLIPFQRYVTRVMTEKNPDGSYRYKTALISVPRQCGKSALVSAIATMRALRTPNSQSFYMAQKGKDGREQIEKTYQAIKNSRFSRMAHHRKSNDTAQVEYSNGSKFRFAVPSDESLHGKTFSHFYWDELFAFDEEKGQKILGAASPAQMTRKDRQTILVSTKGTQTSTYLNAWIKRGRLSTEDADTDMAYFEWALAEGLDANDPANWTFHPGLYGGLITPEVIEEESGKLSKGEYERAMMNRQTVTVESVLDTKIWVQSFATLSTPDPSKIAIGWELAYDRSSAAVVAAWKEGDKVQIKVIRAGAGVSWLPETLKAIYDTRPLDIVADKHPMNQMIVDAFYADHYGAELRILKTDEYKTAGVTFKSLLEDRKLQHDNNAILRDAISTAATKRVGEGWAFSHERSSPALLAAVSAVRAVTEQREHEAPMVYFLDD